MQLFAPARFLRQAQRYPGSIDFDRLRQRTVCVKRREIQVCQYLKQAFCA